MAAGRLMDIGPVPMGSSEARALVRACSAAYERYLAAESAWTERTSREQMAARAEAYNAWQDASERVRAAQFAAPHLFAELETPR
jgi:hypothetical protein